MPTQPVAADAYASEHLSNLLIPEKAQLLHSRSYLHIDMGYLRVDLFSFYVQLKYIFLWVDMKLDS